MPPNCELVFFDSPYFHHIRESSRQLGNMNNKQGFIIATVLISPGTELRDRYSVSQAHRNVVLPPTPPPKTKAVKRGAADEQPPSTPPPKTKAVKRGAADEQPPSTPPPKTKAVKRNAADEQPPSTPPPKTKAVKRGAADEQPPSTPPPKTKAVKRGAADEQPPSTPPPKTKAVQGKHIAASGTVRLDGLDPDCLCPGAQKCKLGFCWFHGGRTTSSRRVPGSSHR
jgi:hypothetical protein